MNIVVTKGAMEDFIEVTRRDGSVTSTVFPHKGPVPHDVVHFFVELELGIDAGFWGLIAAGRGPQEVGAIAKAAGHASAARARAPDSSFVPAIQAERIVECFEADLWGGGSDPHTFNAMVSAGCQQSLVPALDLDDESIARVRSRLQQFQVHWSELPLGGSCSFEWPEEPAGFASRPGQKQSSLGREPT